MLTVGELKEWLENQADDKRVVFSLEGQRLEVAEAYGINNSYVMQLEEAI